MEVIFMTTKTKSQIQNNSMLDTLQMRPVIVQKINPFLWFDNQAGDAVIFYTSLFNNSRILDIAYYGEEGAKIAGKPKDSIMTMEFEIEGERFIAINGGPQFKFTPAISFFVACKTEKEVDVLWKSLGADGKILMKLGKYPFSEKYGWVQDKFGVSWQIMLGNFEQKISPIMLFAGAQRRNAEKAMNYYISLFKNSKIARIERYNKEEGLEGTVKFASFKLHGQEFMAMDSHNDSTIEFNEAVSFVVNCDTQEEINNLWEKLSKGGKKGQCGWLKDKYGVSWQIAPTIIGKLISDTDTQRSKRVMTALYKMHKIDIRKLKQAYDG
jgi:predicted 3-demethylubiquinone-9 3-methyltransferase (glyoxalase superfamily)